MHIHQLMINSRVLMTKSKNFIDTGRKSTTRNWSYLWTYSGNHQREKEEGWWHVELRRRCRQTSHHPLLRRNDWVLQRVKDDDMNNLLWFAAWWLVAPYRRATPHSTPSDMRTTWCGELNGQACTIQPMSSRQLSSRPCRHCSVAEGGGCGAVLRESGGADKPEYRKVKVYLGQRIDGSTPWNRWRMFRCLLTCHCLHTTWRFE
jgi:hypothetical protein